MTARAPQVRIVHGFGLGIADARAARVDVTEQGALEVRRPGGAPPAVTPALDVRRVVWLDADRTAEIFGSRWQRASHRLSGRWMRRRGAGALAGSAPAGMNAGACVVLTDDGPVASWLVDQTTNGPGDAATRRRLGGSVSLARGLGLTLESAGPGDVLRRPEVRSTWLRSSTPSAGLSAAGEVSAVASLLLAVASWATADRDAAPVLATSSLVVGLWVVVATVVLRRRALALMNHPPAADGRIVCRPAGAAADDPQQLQVGTDDVVVVDGDGGETWLPGPALGGVELVMVDASATTFHAADGTVLHTQAGWLLAADDPGARQLEDACRSAGIRADLLSTPTRSSGALNAHIAPGLGAGDLGPLGPYVLAFTPFALIPGGLVAAQDVSWLGGVVVVGAVAMGVGRGWCWWALRRWRRVIERREAQVP